MVPHKGDVVLMGASGIITSRTIGRLHATIRRRIADFLELDPQGGDAPPAQKAIERQIDELRSRLGKALAARRLIEQELHRSARVDLAEKAEFAIARGRDDLARAAVRKNIEIERRNQEFDRELAAIDAEAAALEESLLSFDDYAGRGRLAAMLVELDALMADADAETRAKD